MGSKNNTNVVTFSGGSGHSGLLRGLKSVRNISISAVVAMTDNGKSTGVLRSELGVLPPGDVRRCLAALATKEPELAQTLEVRFTQGFLKGHSFGNLFLVALAEKLGSFEAAVDYTQKILGVAGQVIPCTLELAQLHAQLKDGTHLEGEEKIDVTDDPQRSPVERIWTEPAVAANPRALKAIKAADVLVFGPGDFYTSILPTLLMTGMKEAVMASKAKKILVCNRTQKPGETHGMSALDLVNELERYAGTHVDLLLANNQNDHTGPYPAIEVPWEELTARETEVVMADLADEKDGLRLDGTKVAQALATTWTI